MVEQPSGPAPDQGLADLRQTWEHLAREFAAGVPELPGVIDQELTGLTLPDLNEQNLIKVAEAVVARVAAAGFPAEAAVLFRRMGRAMYELLLLLATQEELRELGMSTPTRAETTVSGEPVPAVLTDGVDVPAPLLASNPPRAAPPGQVVPLINRKR